MFEFLADNEWLTRPLLKAIFLLLGGVMSIILPPICRRIYGRDMRKDAPVHIPGGVFIVIGIVLIAAAFLVYAMSVDPLANTR